MSTSRVGAALHRPSLSTLLNMERVASLESDSVAELWLSYGKSRPGIVNATLSAEAMEVMAARTKQYPRFIVPVPRLTGHEVFLVESRESDDGGLSVAATGLDEYRRSGTAATSSASLSFFVDLVATKQLCLVLGRFDSRILNKTQVASLLGSFCSAYCEARPFDFVRKFTDEPSAFDFDAYMQTFRAQTHTQTQTLEGIAK